MSNGEGLFIYYSPDYKWFNAPVRHSRTRYLSGSKGCAILILRQPRYKAWLAVFVSLQLYSKPRGECHD